MSARIIIGASSAIGGALARDWLEQGHQVVGTFRTKSATLTDLSGQGLKTVKCDLSNQKTLSKTILEISKKATKWNVLALLPATMKPLCPFETCDMALWRATFELNFLNQMELLSGLLKNRDKSGAGALILLFAGGGVNSAPVNSSAYTVSKIATLKMCELLHAEMEDIRIAIIGPGWVDTPIHQEMIDAGPSAGTGFHRTVEFLEKGNFVPMTKIVNFCHWLEQQDRNIIGGRNFSVPHDSWENDADLVARLALDPNMYKLRRSEN